MNADLEYVEIHLPLFKQGSDLAWCLEKTDSVHAAFSLYANQLEKAVMMLRDLANRVRDLPADGVSLEADTHYVGLAVPAHVAIRLVNDELAELPPEMDDEPGPEALN